MSPFIKLRQCSYRIAKLSKKLGFPLKLIHRFTCSFTTLSTGTSQVPHKYLHRRSGECDFMPSRRGQKCLRAPSRMALSWHSRHAAILAAPALPTTTPSHPRMLDGRKRPCEHELVAAACFSQHPPTPTEMYPKCILDSFGIPCKIHVFS